ncbi:MAG: energy-coupling factor ABC transporter ATP-binding protein [Muribaculaceae bacterium]|nr:energy-coupling factor ABC transporter ATP-binding protein [Muribaculaceae bacterium]
MNALEFQDVSFSYPGGREVLRHISFSLQHGEKVALVGLNGSGKSTLLLHTNGLLIADSGKVYVSGKAIDRKSVDECRKSVGMVFQNADDQLFMPTVEADVAFGPRNMGLPEEEIKRRVDKALLQTGCSELKDRAPFHLSGGQKKMASIATVLAMQPNILVFDEPTSGLDFAAEAQFIGIVDRLPHTMLMSTHDMDLARRLCTRAILMDRGAIAYDGPIDTLPYPLIMELRTSKPQM